MNSAALSGFVVMATLIFVTAIVVRYTLDVTNAWRALGFSSYMIVLVTILTIAANKSS